VWETDLEELDQASEDLGTRGRAVDAPDLGGGDAEEAGHGGKGGSAGS